MRIFNSDVRDYKIGNPLITDEQRKFTISVNLNFSKVQCINRYNDDRIVKELSGVEKCSHVSS